MKRRPSRAAPPPTKVAAAPPLDEQSGAPPAPTLGCLPWLAVLVLMAALPILLLILLVPRVSWLGPLLPRVSIGLSLAGAILAAPDVFGKQRLAEGRVAAGRLANRLEAFSQRLIGFGTVAEGARLRPVYWSVVYVLVGLALVPSAIAAWALTFAALPAGRPFFLQELAWLAEHGLAVCAAGAGICSVSALYLVAAEQGRLPADINAGCLLALTFVAFAPGHFAIGLVNLCVALPGYYGAQLARWLHRTLDANFTGTLAAVGLGLLLAGSILQFYLAA